jgi:hypothetical protein
MVQVHSLYGGYFPNPAPLPQNQVYDLSKVLYTSTPQGQGQPNRRSTAYQDSSPNMNCYEHPSPMLGHDYAQLSLGRGRGSFAEFSNARHVFKDFKYQPSTESASSSFTTTTPSNNSTCSYSDEGSNFDHPSGISSTSPDTVYSCYSPETESVSLHVPRSSSTRNVKQMEARARWWPGSTKSARIENQTTYDLDLNMSFNGLPRYQAEPQPAQYSGPWSMTLATPVNKWTSQVIEPKTISPKALTLNASSGSLASFGSTQVSVMGLSVSSTATSIADGAGDLLTHENLVVVEPQKPIQQSVRRLRQIVPSDGPSFRRVVPVPTNDFPPSRNLRKRSVKAIEPENHVRRSSPPSKLAPTTKSRAHRPKGESSKSSAPKTQRRDIVPKPTEPPTSASEPSWGSSAVTKQAGHQRDARNDYLVKSKLAGMSYKEIREQGNFTEAESTLRGRFRTLTKSKAARVRKPEWNDNDVSLL